jgi:hypothetical protein
MFYNRFVRSYFEASPQKEHDYASTSADANF